MTEPTATVARKIVSFSREGDDGDPGEWVASLECGHRRHIRHQPPLSSYPWIEDPEGRARHLGEPIECGRCLTREWPEQLEAYRSTPLFDETSLPKGLLSDHRTRAGVWGRLEVSAGHVELCFAAPLDQRVRVSAGEWAAIPPELGHHLELDGPVVLRVVFHRLL